MNKIVKFICIFCCALLGYNILMGILTFRSEDARLLVLVGIVLSFNCVVGCLYTIHFDENVSGKKGFIFIIAFPLLFYWMVLQVNYNPLQEVVKNIYLGTSILLCISSFTLKDDTIKPHVITEILESKTFTILVTVCIGYLLTTYGIRVFIYSLTDKPITVENCVLDVYLEGSNKKTFITIDYNFYEDTIESAKCSAARYDVIVNNQHGEEYPVVGISGLREGDVVTIKMMPSWRILNMEIEESEMIVEIKDRPVVIEDFTPLLESKVNEVIARVYPELLGKEVTVVFYRESIETVLSFFVLQDNEVREYGIVNPYENSDGSINYDSRKYKEYEGSKSIEDRKVIGNKKVIAIIEGTVYE